jgi:peptidyl-prolyl cis-trans isomerase D
MPLMTQIRNSMTKLFGAFAILFILYIMLDWGMDLTGLKRRGGDAIGVVNGQDISSKEYSDVYRRAVEAQRAQSGGQLDDETERQIQEQVWGLLVNQILVNQEMDRLGITVSDQEIVDWVRGPNPPEALVNQFRDTATGQFNRTNYEMALNDPRNREAWIAYERQLREQRKSEKLQSLMLATVRVTEGEVLQRYLDRNLTMDASYVLFDPSRIVADSLAVPTEDDLEKYYQEHQDDFKVQPSRKLKYVLFPTVPSSQDTADVVDELTQIQSQIKGGSDFNELAKTYSEVPSAEAFFKHGELTAAKETAVFSASKGEVVGPIIDFDGVHLIKIIDDRLGSGDFVRASHILLTEKSDSTRTPEELGRELIRRLRGGADFGALARQYSGDPGSASKGGDLGWGGRGAWVKPFEDAAFGAKAGEIVGPIRTPFGWHIIKVTGRDRREVKITTISMKIKTSPQTVATLSQKAEDFAYLAKDEGFERSAELSGYEVRETIDFTKGGMIPGIGYSDAAMNFAFSEKLNTISPVLQVSGGIAVFKVSKVTEEGVRPLDEVKALLEASVRKAKKFDAVRPRVVEFRSTLGEKADLVAAAAGRNDVTSGSTGPFKPTDSPPKIGRDLAFIGAAMALPPGAISQPVEGSRGFYLIELKSKTPFDSLQYANQSTSIREQLLQEKRNRFSQEWIMALREKAVIEDNRYKLR